MKEVEWMRNPKNGRLIGHIFIRNMHLYSSGRNLNMLDRNIKQQGAKYKIPASLLRLAFQPSESIDLTYATNVFLARYVNKVDLRYIDMKEARKMIDENREKKEELHSEDLNDKPVEVSIDQEPTVEDDCAYITKEKDGKICVYKVIKVAEYKMFEQEKPIVAPLTFNDHKNADIEF